MGTVWIAEQQRGLRPVQMSYIGWVDWADQPATAQPFDGMGS